jgi:hypothetical protein
MIKENNLAPICLFVYNRLWHTLQTIEALQKNEFTSESELFIFSDGPKNPESASAVNEVRNYIKNVAGFKKVTINEREKNYGLANSIISGVTDIIGIYGKIIVLEDDMVSSPYFLKYMNEALDFYENEEKVISIHGYIYPVTKSLPETFFLKGADCWGWATWKRGWDLFESDGKKLLDELTRRSKILEFDFNGSFNYAKMLEKQISGQNNSWAIRWYASAFLKDKLTLYPGKTLINNIGLDIGTHCNNSDPFRNENLADKPIAINAIPLSEDLSAKKAFIKFFNSLKPSLWERMTNKINRYVKN